MADPIPMRSEPKSDVAEEDHPLLIVIARAVYEHVNDKHKASIRKALAQYGRGSDSDMWIDICTVSDKDKEADEKVGMDKPGQADLGAAKPDHQD